ncbi:alpha/beta fold hydrolase [Streptomyces corynorhini]|uniref:Alpha/beta fold hydrolase n=1 Tax=Streptomyces corynorhini TaxID=2282652 RepID=A0A370BE30_9ACTN|nr:alpha/beta hydrolase family protein [Streptomyces corynorhini]RDG39911.1 alpha/beta fold hydrolase [Streptomyces corynorhini]
MMHTVKATAMAVLCCAVVGTGLVACEDSPSPAEKAVDKSIDDAVDEALDDALGNTFTGTKKIKVGDRSVNVSCSGKTAEKDQPLVLLLAGVGDGLGKIAGLQKTLSEQARVCSYDRLGEGASDKPKGLQHQADSAKILTAVLDDVAGDRPAVLAGHSLGGQIAARYAPEHQDRVKGLVLMDATIPALNAGVSKAIPKSATGQGAQLLAGTIAANSGENQEKFVIEDAKVSSAGDIPVEIIKHESQYAEVPEYGPALEEMWSKGQEQWLALSSNSKLSTAAKSGHYIYVDRPDLAIKAVRKVTAQATDDLR